MPKTKTKPKAKRSIAERAWSFFRRTIQGKADCVVVFRLTRCEDDSWNVDWAAKHWLDEEAGAGVVGDGLPKGAGWAISEELARGSFSRTVGPMAADTILNAAGSILGAAVGKATNR